jgi:uncharacterized protein (DUF433 family)
MYRVCVDTLLTGVRHVVQGTVDYVYTTAEGGWRIADTRVSLDSVVCAYWDGRSPEAIVDEFPTLTAEQVYGAIAFYLRNQQEIDLYVSQQRERWKGLAQQSEAQHKPLLDRLRAHRSNSSVEPKSP